MGEHSLCGVLARNRLAIAPNRCPAQPCPPPSSADARLARYAPLRSEARRPSRCSRPERPGASLLPRNDAEVMHATQPQHPVVHAAGWRSPEPAQVLPEPPTPGWCFPFEPGESLPGPARCLHFGGPFVRNLPIQEPSGRFRAHGRVGAPGDDVDVGFRRCMHCVEGRPAADRCLMCTPARGG